MDDNTFAARANAVSEFIASASLLQDWPESRQLVLKSLPQADPWNLVLPDLSCLCVGGVPFDAVPVAAGWFCLHCAAHLLDAVQDGDSLETPCTHQGAIGVSTSLIFTAFQFFNSIPSQDAARRVTALFSEAGFKSAQGQYLALSLNREMPVNNAINLYWRAVTLKSGSIFRSACAGGAAVGTDDERLINALGDYGTALGVMLQILDDCRDVMEERNVGIADAQITLPLLLYSMNLGGERINIPNVSSKEILFSLLSEANVPQAISAVLSKWRQRALESLSAVKSSETVTVLENILDLVLETLPQD